jgi:hypothetical protein
MGLVYHDDDVAALYSRFHETHGSVPFQEIAKAVFSSPGLVSTTPAWITGSDVDVSTPTVILVLLWALPVSLRSQLLISVIAVFLCGVVVATQMERRAAEVRRMRASEAPYAQAPFKGPSSSLGKSFSSSGLSATARSAMSSGRPTAVTVSGPDVMGIIGSSAMMSSRSKSSIPVSPLATAASHNMYSR